MRIRTPHDLAAVTKGRRLDHGWTQAEAAQRAGVSRKWVSDVENGKASVDLGAVLRLLDVLDIHLQSVDSASNELVSTTAGVDLDQILDEYLNR